MRKAGTMSARLLALVLCAVMLIAMVPEKAFAALATPVMNSAVASGTGIKVTWSAVTGATGYRLYRKGGGSGWKALKDVSGTSYTDTSAKAGTTYTYTARAMVGGVIQSGYDSVGVSAAWTTSTAGYIATPTLVSAKAESTGIRVTWKKVSGATGYRIYRKTTGSWSNLATVGNVDNYLDTSAASGTKYTYTVRCMKSGSICSDYNKTGVSATWNAPTGLATPKLNSATAEGSGIRVTWQAVAGATGYRVYRKTTGAWQHLVDVTGTTYLDNATTKNVVYTYTVRCLQSGKLASSYDKTGVSGKWTSPGGPYATPVLKSVKASGNSVVFTWNAVSGAPAYRVFRKTNGGGWIGLANTTGTSYTDSGVVSNNTYTYTVRVVNGSTMASGYDPTGLSIAFYSMPELVSAKSVSTGIQITWKAVAGAPRYLIYRKTGGSYTRLASTTGTSYIDAGIALGVTYTYTVRVCSADEKSLLSDYDHAGISAAYIGKAAITSLSAEPTGVQVKWNSMPGASKYRLQRKFGTGDWATIYTGTATQYLDSDVVTNITYTYRVQALDSSDKVAGSYEEDGRSITFYATPTLVSCVRVSGGLTTTWEAVEGVTNYMVFRKIGSGTWVRMGSTTGTSYTDYTVPSGTLCYYTVRCLSADGSSYLSSYDHVGIGETSYMDTPVLLNVTPQNGYLYISWQPVDKATKYKVYRKNGDKTSWDVLGTSTTTGFSDTNVINGGTYTYTVATCDATDVNLSEYDPTGLTATYYMPPVLVKAENVKDGIKVTWNPVQGIGVYNVYRKTGSSGWTFMRTVNGTEYTDDSAVTNGHYWYTVTCVQAGSEVSAYDTAGVSNTYYAPPQMESIKNNNGSITVTWYPVDGIGTYKLYRKINGGTWYAVTDVSGTTYTDSSVASGNKYSYTVRCVAGGSLVSDYNSEKTIRYLGVTTTTATSTVSGQASITWTKVTGATKYNVYRKRTVDSGWSLVANLGNVESYTDTTGTKGTTYYYMTVAIDDEGYRSADGNPSGACTIKY